ncbi:MAG: Gldg family protein [Anaerolineae bacterium]|nr:Gldg family protein [Anaerolineae bacterium]
MNKSTQQTLTSLLPWLGVVLLLSGAITYLMVNRFTTLVNVLIGTGALLLLLFAIFRPDDVRLLFSGRQFRYGLNTVLAIVFVVAIAAILYYVAYRNNDWRYDVTETGEFTPLPETLSILRGLDEPIHIIGFYSSQLSLQQQNARTTLESLRAYTDQISYEFQDPYSNPLLVGQYSLTQDGTLVFTRGQGADQVFSKTSSLAERDLHTALIQVLNPQEKKIYFLTGHGEPAFDSFDETGLSDAQATLQESGFTLETLNLFVTGSVPEDASVVAVIDPQTMIPPQEVEALRSYVNSGGALFVAQDFPNSQAMLEQLLAGEDTLSPLLAEWGLEVRADIVVDLTLAQAGQADGATFIGGDFGSSPIIVPELSTYGIVFRFARSIGITPVSGVNQVELVRTSANAWGETDIMGLLGQSGLDRSADDNSGPLVVGASAENFVTGGRVVVFGDSDFMRNQIYRLNGNSILVPNIMNWLARDEFTIDLTPRDSVQRTITIPQEQLMILMVLTTCLGPFLMLFIGGVVWYSRRQVR